MFEPNEPHDEWGRPIIEQQPLQKQSEWTRKLRDILAYTFLGLLFVIVVVGFYLVFLPYYLGREVWQKLERFYINK